MVALIVALPILLPMTIRYTWWLRGAPHVSVVVAYVVRDMQQLMLIGLYFVLLCLYYTLAPWQYFASLIILSRSALAHWLLYRFFHSSAFFFMSWHRRVCLLNA
jgi:hypothetical protein